MYFFVFDSLSVHSVFPCTFISAPRSARTMTAEFLVVGIYIFNCHIKLLTKSRFYFYVYLSVCFTLRTICTYTNNDLVKYCSNKIKSITVVGILFCFIWKISSSSSYICLWNCNYSCHMFYKWSLQMCKRPLEKVSMFITLPESPTKCSDNNLNSIFM